MTARRVLRSLALAVLAVLAACAAASATPAKPARPAAHRPAPRAATPDSLERAHRVGPRTLDDIHIEGEIPVPQVLFITARDQRRFMEFQHHRYQRTSLELGRATPSPTRIVVSEPTPAERKENQR